ncbi:MAG TPA: hypothetical protein VEO01_26005 [Pseudonocardiaceae bacterium]|nr:hypothetical protein [Pseudonocardiaceae bacterium]
MTPSQIRAMIDDGPRRGETVVVDTESDNSPPHEIMLPDGHAGVRSEGGQVPHPTGSVSRYRLIDTGGGTDFHYKVVPHGG